MSNQATNIHDAFFKRALGDSQAAGTFLREHLPRDVAALLSAEPPEPVPGSFVDEELRQHHSDLLFRMRLKTADDAFAYLLMEHKSSPDAGARLQLLRYVVRFLVSWYEQNGRRLPLPPVIPLLAHHGAEGWTLSCEFADLFGTIPDALRPFIPSFRHVLVDLARIDDAALSTEVRLRARLKALKYIFRSDLQEYVDILLAEASALENSDIVLILTYVGKGPVSVSNAVIRKALHRWVPSREQEIMASFGQEYFDDGKAAGILQGRIEGRARWLVRLLEKRFGPVPPGLRQRIDSADAESLDVWFENATDAPDLASVFGSPTSRSGSTSRLSHDGRGARMMVSMEPQPLTGRVIAIPETREIEVFAALLERRGATVVRCPMVAIRDAPDPAPVLQWSRQFADGACDDLILQTGEGLRRILSCIDKNEPGLKDPFVQRLAHVRKITRGPKPARALRDLDLKPDIAAEVPTTEGVINSLRSHNLTARRIGLQLYGTEPNRPLVDFLEGAGARVLVVAPYVYADAADDQAVLNLINRLQAGEIDAIAFTSTPQVERLFSIAPAETVSKALTNTVVAAIGPVVAETLRKHSVEARVMPEDSFFLKPLTTELEEALGARG